MEGFTQWVRGQDQLGSWAKFNYRGDSGYGTFFGGICSLIVTLIAGAFIFIQLFGLVFEPDYNQQLTTLYYTNELVEYTMQPGDYLPTFLIYSRETQDFNDADSFEFYYETFANTIVSPSESAIQTERVDVINCVEYINGPYWDQYSEAER